MRSNTDKSDLALLSISRQADRRNPYDINEFTLAATVQSAITEVPEDSIIIRRAIHRGDFERIFFENRFNGFSLRHTPNR